MHPRLTQMLERALVATSLLVVTPGLGAAQADDTGFFSRLFRGGSSTTPSANSGSPNQSGGASYGRSAASPGGLGGTDGSSFTPSYGGLSQTPVTTPPAAAASGPGQRLSPRPRVSSAVTNADPLLTRFALGRSNDGSQFGMFLQIFADGTVIDSEGVHRLRPADLKPIMDLVQSGDLFRARGHCGAPATDFIEYVNVVVYERRLGRLSANSFSYSGNTQGCDHAIHRLHTTLENLQAKLSRQGGGNQPAVGASRSPVPYGPAAGPVPLSPTSEHAPPPPAVNPGESAPGGGVIPLTPIDSSR